MRVIFMLGVAYFRLIEWTALAVLRKKLKTAVVTPNEVLSAEEIGEECADRIQGRNDNQHGHDRDVRDVLESRVPVFAHGFLIIQKQDQKNQRRGQQSRCQSPERTG